MDDQPRFDSFHRIPCQLTWRIRTLTNKNVVFIVTGQDQGGMWHFVAGNLTSSKLELEPGFGAKYPTLAVIAVDSENVLDILRVNLPRYEECVREEDTVVDVLGDDLIIVIILSVVVVALFIILLTIICCNKSEAHMGRKSNTENLDRIIATKQRQEVERFSAIKSSKLTPILEGIIV